MTGSGPDASAPGSGLSLVPVLATPIRVDPSPPVPARHGMRRRRLLSALVVVVLVAAAWRLQGALGEAVAALRSLDLATLGAVLGCWVLVVLARGLLYRSALPRGTLGQGLVLDQVNLAVGNAVPGGAVLGATLRYRVGRSLGHRPDEMALCMVAVGDGISVGRWLLVIVVLGASVVGGTASGVDVAVLGVAVVALVVSAFLWRVLSRDTPIAGGVVRATNSFLRRAGRRVPRLAGRRVDHFVAELRDGAAWLLSTRAWRVVGAGMVVTAGGAAIVVLVVQGVGGADAPGTWDIVRVYLLARVAAGVSPTPGGVGAVEGALTGGLVAAGAGPADAVAAVLVYRGLTFVLPMATGSAVYLGWRRWMRARRFLPDGPGDRVPTTPVAPGPAPQGGKDRIVDPIGQTAGHGAVARSG